MTNYQITFGYRAIITVDVKAENPEDAKKAAMERMKKIQTKIANTKDVSLQDDNFKPDGILDMDATWNSYYK